MSDTDCIDPIAQMHRQQRAARMAAPKVVQRTSYWENAKYPLSFVGAFVLGVLATMFGRYCQFHMLGLPVQAENPDIQMVMDNVFVGLIAVVVRLLVSYATHEHMVAQMAGVWLVILTFHNLPHWAPMPMSMVFSPEYVHQAQAATNGNSILFRGAEFYFGKPPVFERK
ncbi:hypothetical protein [Tropicibacter oceani]|uniref:Uncharacterized protein n=1 Tax=Tropicibacter oceani TaxID=3058420 RepID=A0ABY8QGN7_9RHOB|nr:hypothetical protein [Tropicibacter oceani]WGW03196.1 hypothetical protein QF118_14875 [Tropicibacter oceani]